MIKIVAYITNAYSDQSTPVDSSFFDVNFSTTDGLFSSSGAFNALIISNEAAVIASLKTQVAAAVNVELGTSYTAADVLMF